MASESDNMKAIGKLCEGKPRAQFDEGTLETEMSVRSSGTLTRKGRNSQGSQDLRYPPRLRPTLLIILFSERSDLDVMKTLLAARLAQFGLSIAEDKTHMTDLTARPNQGSQDRQRMTFLRFSIFRGCTRDRKRTKVVLKTEGKRFTRAKLRLKERLHEIMHLPVKEQAKSINSALRGHYNYYGIAGNSKCLQNMWHFVRLAWRRSLSQRSQKGKVNWEQMAEYLSKSPLIAPSLKVPYPALQPLVRL